MDEILTSVSHHGPSPSFESDHGLFSSARTSVAQVLDVKESSSQARGTAPAHSAPGRRWTCSVFFAKSLTPIHSSFSEKIAPGADDAVRSDLRFINHEWVFEASFLIFAVIVHFLEGLICCFTRSTWPLEGFYLYSAPGWPLGPFIFIRTPVPSFRTICQKTKVSIRYSIAFCERGHMTSIDKLWFGLWYDNPKLKRFFIVFIKFSSQSRASLYYEVLLKKHAIQNVWSSGNVYNKLTLYIPWSWFRLSPRDLKKKCL